jgi:hypothetical protein
VRDIRFVEELFWTKRNTGIFKFIIFVEKLSNFTSFSEQFTSN